MSRTITPEEESGFSEKHIPYGARVVSSAVQEPAATKCYALPAVLALAVPMQAQLPPGEKNRVGLISPQCLYLSTRRPLMSEELKAPSGRRCNARTEQSQSRSGTHHS